jgi:hypothetical protein
VLVAERHDAGAQLGTGSESSPNSEDALAQLVDVEVAGVDHHVGLGLDRVEQHPLASMASTIVCCRLVAQRVAPPGALVALRPGRRSRPRGTGCAPGQCHLGDQLRRQARTWSSAGQHVVETGAGAHHQHHLRESEQNRGGGTSDPGADASSATLGMSWGGRLSMTNHPRSSRWSAARDRPAPDSPVMTMNSLQMLTGLPRAVATLAHAGRHSVRPSVVGTRGCGSRASARATLRSFADAWVTSTARSRGMVAAPRTRGLGEEARRRGRLVHADDAAARWRQALT